MLCGVVGKRHKNALWENGAPFRSSLGRGEVAPHPKQKRGAKSPPPPHPHTDVFDNTCDINDFREHIFCPQNYLRIKQDCLNNYPQWYIVTNRLRTKTLWRLLVPTNNAKGILENLSRSMRMAEWKQNRLLVEKALRCFSDTLTSS